MGFTLSGLPEVSKTIDMPDIGELLCYPMFQNADPEAFLKYAPEFLRYLFHQVPLKNNRKYVTVYSSTHLTYPNVRTMTHFGERALGNPDSEWHIDSLGEYDYQVPSEGVHLLLSHCEARTEFNTHPIDFSHLPSNMPKTDFINIFHRLVREKDPRIEATMIDQNRIYTFDNHMHRATNPTGIELRYSFRVRETDKNDPPYYNKDAMQNRLNINAPGTRPVPNVHREDGKVTVYIPNQDLFKKGEPLDVKQSNEGGTG